jgi:MazG family protein
MPLLVVPVYPDQTGWLTLEEWDALVACERVLFERGDHPLIERLHAHGIAAGPFDDEPDASKEGWALVADPDSGRILELARAGARVTSGVASAPDALTAAHAAPTLRKAAAALSGLVAVMARLRSDDGCPWDREQTHESLKIHLLEEAYEVIDAIDRGETGAEFEEELGDVLLQVAFHSRLAEQEDRFDIGGVADRIVTKLLHRHPHVFGETTVADAHEVVRNWEQIKTVEKERTDPFEGIPTTLPALLTAYKVQKRAARLGFEADDSEALERLAQAAAAGDVGDALFWLVAVARRAGVDPEGALRASVEKFKRSL